MATKAERFRAESERHGNKPPKVIKPRRVQDPLHTDTRNLTKRVNKREGPVLEDSMTGRPSRKSTRTTSHHGRTDTKLMRAAQQATHSAKSRATRAQAARRK